MLLRLPYTLLWLLALPAVVVRLLWRARRQPDYLHHLGERFGLYASPRPDAPLLWVHAVSVGETRAAEPLVRAMLARWPTHHILLTQMTPTGRATAAELFRNEPRVLTAWLPYDLPPAITGFLRRFKPQLGVIMETELWPNLLAACQRAGVPVMLANARLSARSARRYARWPSLTRATLGSLRAIGAQTEADAERLRALGASGVSLTGNIKFDITPPATLLELGLHLRDLAGHRPTVLAASTREGEEAPLVEAFLRLAPPEALLLLVPRHPQRFEEVANLVRATGARLQKRSTDAPLAPDTRVWLGDTMGEMFAYYAAAQVALIGGSWQPLGGQNLIEACAVGTPVVMGPHTFNFAQVAEQAEACGAALRASDAEAGMRLALELLADLSRRSHMGAAGRHYAQAHRGATARSLAVIETLNG